MRAARIVGLALAAGVALGVGFAAADERLAPARSAAPAATVTAPAHFANADDLSKVVAGKTLYLRWCASCHGRRLQGQPLWQLNDQYAGRRAPAHDQTGHTWAHSDDELFFMTQEGRFPAAAAGVTSYMPAFRDYLSDEQIVAVIAFIKANWSIGLRISQALLNPGNAGLPAAALDNNDWTLPPTCVISSQRWRTTSR